MATNSSWVQINRISWRPAFQANSTTNTMANTATVVVATRKVTQIAAINVNIIMDVVTNRIAVITIQIAAITIQIAAITTQIAVITGDQDSSHCSAAVAADTGNSWAAALH